MNHLKSLFFADPGAGKTHLLGTVVNVPELMGNLFIDFEGNTDSIESKCVYIGENEEGFEKLQTFDPPKDKITVIRCKCRFNTFLEKENDIDFTGLKVYQKVINWVFNQKENLPYKSLSIDSQSAFDWWGGKWILKNYPLKNGRFNEEVFEVPDYGKLLDMHFKTMGVLVDLPIHLFVTAQTYSETAKLGGAITAILPRLTGQARTAVTGILKMSAYLRVADQGKRRLHFENWGLAVAKTCSEGLFPPYIDNPTMKQIYNLRYGVK